MSNAPSKYRSICLSHQSYRSANHISFVIQCNCVFQLFSPFPLQNPPPLGADLRFKNPPNNEEEVYVHRNGEKTVKTSGTPLSSTSDSVHGFSGASKSCLMTVAPKAKAGTPAKEPPNLPTAVRLQDGGTSSRHENTHG